MEPKLILSLAILSGITAASGVTLIGDNFDNVASAGSISGRSPTSGTLSLSRTWNSSTSNLLGDGSGGLAVNYTTLNAGASATIDLGTSYLSTNKGIYEISMDITHPSGTSNDSWIGMGFANGNNTSSNFVGNNGNPWMIYRLSGNINVWDGPAVSNNLIQNVPTGTSGATLGAAHTFKIILDTSATNWVMQAFVDSYEFDLNGATAGNSYEFTTNPTSRYVGFSTNVNATSASASTIDNFKLDFTAVPEPSAMLLGAVGTLVILRRRK